MKILLAETPQVNDRFFLNLVNNIRIKGGKLWQRNAFYLFLFFLLMPIAAVLTVCFLVVEFVPYLVFKFILLPLLIFISQLFIATWDTILKRLIGPIFFIAGSVLIIWLLISFNKTGKLQEFINFIINLF